MSRIVPKCLCGAMSGAECPEMSRNVPKSVPLRTRGRMLRKTISTVEMLCAPVSGWVLDSSNRFTRPNPLKIFLEYSTGMKSVPKCPEMSRNRFRDISGHFWTPCPPDRRLKNKLYVFSSATPRGKRELSNASNRSENGSVDAENESERCRFALGSPKSGI